MTNSLKIGAVSGLIAGIVAGIIYQVVYTGFVGDPFGFDPGKGAALGISFTTIWGIVLGVIYSRVHQVISDKVINKGLLYGLFCALVARIRDISFGVAYSAVDPLWATKYSIGVLIAFIAFGLVLAALYGRWCKEEKQKVVTYDMRSGIHPGAIAGLIGGVLAYFLAVFYPYIGLYPPEYPGYLTDIGFMMSQFGTHAFIHMIWGAFFGAIFARAYNVVPKKGVVKGFCYGLFIFFVSAVQLATLDWALGFTFSSMMFMWWGVQYFMFDMLVYPLYGIVLGYLYKK